MRLPMIRFRTIAGLAAILGGALALGNCDSPSGPVAQRRLFPLATGNFWVYVDSYFDHGNVVQVRVDTSIVTGTDSALGGLWWHIRQHTRGTWDVGSQVQLRDDGLHAVMFGFPGRFYESRTLLVPRDTAYSYNYLYQGDIAVYRTVRKLPDRVTVPAGTFGDCVEYEDQLATNVLAQGVGILRRTTPLDFFDSTRTTSTLVDFRLR